MNYKLYEVSANALSDYRKNVKGNSTTSRALAKRKLTRNILLGTKLYGNGDSKSVTVYAYGYLHIYTRGNKIVKVKNVSQKIDWFYKDMKRYEELNKYFEIDKYEELCNIKETPKEETDEISETKPVSMNLLTTLKVFTQKLFVKVQ